MVGFDGSLARTPAVLIIALACLASTAGATGVPIDGFLPLVGITLTDEFIDDIDFSPYPSYSLGGTPISRTGNPYYDIALLDTGAAVSLLTAASDTAFNLRGPYPGESDGFAGTEFLPIGGATGLLQAKVSDPLGLYAAGLQTRTSAGASLALNASALLGQTNTSLATLPAESELPNILGLTFASQYATRIRNSQPQIFDLGGKTVRTPAVDFLPIGTGNTHGITRKAPMEILGAMPSDPIYQLNIGGVLNGDDSWENPASPTFVQGGHFLTVNTSNDGTALNGQKFFFDTGASVSVLSQLTALQLGIDVGVDVPDFTIEIIGSGGGSGAVPGYFIDQFTVLATGGSVTLNNVPVLVFDVTNPASPGNVVPGIVGTNVFSGRDIIIDPNPSLGGGGSSAGVYISDSVTSQANWSSLSVSSAWTTGSNWNTAAAPGIMAIANVRTHPSANGNQEAILSSAATVWEANIAGTAGHAMKVRVASGGKLTTFIGVNIETHGTVQLEGGSLDAQYVEILGGTLTGSGSIMTGSGPIAGQVENRNGIVAPGVGVGAGTLSITGRFANSHDGQVNIELGGLTPGTQYDQLLVDGTAALEGTLNVSLINLGGGMFAPTLGSVFSIINAATIGGKFDVLNLPGLPTGRSWFVDYRATELLLKVTLPGDFDGNGSVNATDLAIWKAGYGTTYNGNDFLAWQRYFGSSIPALAAVPEPAAGAMLAVALGWFAMRRRASRAGVRS